MLITMIYQVLKLYSKDIGVANTKDIGVVYPICVIFWFIIMYVLIRFELAYFVGLIKGMFVLFQELCYVLFILFTYLGNYTYLSDFYLSIFTGVVNLDYVLSILTNFYMEFISGVNVITALTSTSTSSLSLASAGLSPLILKLKRKYTDKTSNERDEISINWDEQNESSSSSTSSNYQECKEVPEEYTQEWKWEEVPEEYTQDLQKRVIEMEIDKIFKEDKESDILPTLPNEFEINLRGIIIKIIYNNFTIDNNNNMESWEIYNSIILILEDIKSINSKGFVNSLDLTEYPIINQFIQYFTKDQEFIKGVKSQESYKWIYNIIMLMLYELTIQELNKMEGENELVNDFRALNRELIGKLDPSIRNKIQKHGISIIQDINVGFDTEYVNIDVNKNKLISSQLAINTRTSLKVLNNVRYTISKVDTLGNVSYGIRRYKEFNFELVEIWINSIINRIRKIKYSKSDEFVERINKYFEKRFKYIQRGDFIIYLLPRTPTLTYIDYSGVMSMKKLLGIINKIVEQELINEYDEIINKFKIISDREENGDYKIELLNFNEDNEEMVIKESEITLGEIKRMENINRISKNNIELKNLRRSFMTSFTGDRISISKRRKINLICHLSKSDLSMLSDFSEFSKFLTIINNTYVTLGRAIIIEGCEINIRDTYLLSAAGSKSLDSIGKLYGIDLAKIIITRSQLEDMESFLKEDKELFDKYAIKDSIITLHHANFMEDFNNKINCIGIPVTLSSLGKNYVLYEWKGNVLQISGKYKIGDASTVQTPKGLQSMKEIGLKMSMYIHNYKGGRNESFMYGCDLDRIWNDYDLVSAYTTVMSLLGLPDFDKGRNLKVWELDKMNYKEVLYSYTIINVGFKFDDNTKYPSIPCYVNETTTVYPLEGNAILTGSEYLLAKSQGCKLDIREIYYIPYIKENIDKESKTLDFDRNVYPFMGIINNLQEKRRSYPKGSINNLLYKEIGNSIYGQLVRGISDKRKYDLKSGNTIRMGASDLSHPVLASWITAFIRSIIGECLHAIDSLGGKVVSVTTDGFITDIEDLENKILNKEKGNTLLKEYRRMRENLSGDATSLELKNTGRGIMSWTTRGQLGIESKIKATTGFQTNKYTRSELIEIFNKVFKSKEKLLEYIQESLRGAKEIYLHGGHVTSTYKDQLFRLQYDNRRRIILPERFKDKIDFSDLLLDSKPVNTKEECDALRYLGNLQKQVIYNRYTSVLSGNKYKDYTELAVRNFIKIILSKATEYNLKSMTYNEIEEFIKEYGREIGKKLRVSKQSISNLKNRKMVFKIVPRTKETEKFVTYVKKRFVNFREDLFLK